MAGYTKAEVAANPNFWVMEDEAPAPEEPKGPQSPQPYEFPLCPAMTFEMFFERLMAAGKEA